MAIFYGNLYVFISYGNERIFHFMENYMIFFHFMEFYMFLFYVNLYVFISCGNEHIFQSIYFMWKRTHFPLRDFIGKTGSFEILGKACLYLKNIISYNSIE